MNKKRRRTKESKTEKYTREKDKEIKKGKHTLLSYIFHEPIESNRDLLWFGKQDKFVCH